MTQPVKGRPPHPSERLNEKRRVALFHAATEEFSANGFTQASLNRIISSVSMSKSSFYHYFENKTDLFVQTLNQMLGPMLEAQRGFDVETLEADNFWPMIEAYATDLAGMANDTRDAAMIGRIFYRSLDAPDERALVADLLDQSNQFLIALLQRGQTLGCIRNDLPLSLMIDMLMGLSTSADRWLLANWSDFDDKGRLEISQKMVDLIRRLVEPRP